MSRRSITNRFQTLLNERAKLKISKKEFFKQELLLYQLKICKSAEIANIILFLCEDQSGIITGTSIVADGGQVKASKNKNLLNKIILQLISLIKKN